LRVGAVAMAVLFASLPARADRYDKCFDTTVPDSAIGACSALIWKETMTSLGAAMVHVARGQAYEDKGDFRGAFLDYRQAMTYYPAYTLAHRNRSRLYYRTGDYERALRDAETAVKLTPKTALAYDARALAKAALGRADEARADTATAAMLAGDMAQPNNARCWLRAVLNQDLSTALAACDLAIAKDAKNAYAYDSRGFVQFRLGNVPQARADYEAALALKPQAIASLFMRGVIKRRTGDTSGGDADIAAAMARNPNIRNEYGLYGVRE
jgi:tetratricopeptide (TPR) repeat protein